MRVPAVLLSTALLAVALGSPGPADGAERPRGLPAPLGTGWSSVRERATPEPCVAGREETRPARARDLGLERPLPPAEAARALGVPLATRARFVVLAEGPVAAVAALAADGQLAHGEVFGATAECARRTLARPALTAAARALEPARFEAACGDAFVAAVTTGVRLVVGVQLRTAAAPLRNVVPLAGGLREIAARVRALGPGIGPRAALAVAAVQVGGVPARLATTGFEPGRVLECPLAAAGPCADALDALVRYAATLPEQLDDAGCAPLDAEVAPYTAAGAERVGGAADAAAPVRAARRLLHQAFEHDLRWLQLTDVLASPALAGAHERRRVSGARRERAALTESLAALTALVPGCWDDPAAAGCADGARDAVERRLRRPVRADFLGAPSFVHLCRDARAVPDAPATATIVALLNAVRAGALARRDVCRRAADLLERRSDVDLADLGLRDAEPLAALPWMRKIRLAGNALTDVTALADLPLLAELDVADNQIADVTPLATVFLERAVLARNRIADVGPLGRVATLASLDVGGNAVRDLRPLCGCPRLTRLRVAANPLDPSATAGLRCLLAQEGRVLGDTDLPDGPATRACDACDAILAR